MKVKTKVPFDKDVMPICGYFGPFRMKAAATKSGIHPETYYDYVTDEIYQLIQESGVNLIVRSDNDYAREGGREQILDNLALGDKYSIGMLITDSRITGTEEQELLEKYVKEFRKYDSFRGISIIDEPVTSYYGGQYYEQGVRPLENYAAKSTLVNSSPDMIGYINLNPMGPNLVTEGDVLDVYGRYVEEFITTCHPKVISWDYYPFGGTSYYAEGDRTGYFKNLGLMRDKSLKYHIPFWSFVQAGYYWNDGENDPGEWDTDDTIPTEHEFLWNVNTALAYGAKGIEYFTLVQPFWFAYGGRNGAVDNFNRNGLIGADGSRTQWFAYAKKVNQWVAVVDEVLMNSESTHVLVTGGQAQYDTGIEEASGGIVEDIQAETGAIVGVFDYQGKTACYVVNYDTEHTRNITLKWKDVSTYSVCVQGTDGTETYTNDTCRLTLKAGHGALVVFN